MNEIPQPPDDNELNALSELSEDDLAVLRAFEAAEELVVKDSSADVAAPGDSSAEQSPISQSPQPSSGEVAEEMLVLFVTEADEDIMLMRESLRHLEQDDSADPASLMALQRTAHKLKGTAGSIGYERISIIAQYVEKFVAAVKNGTINNLAGLTAIMYAIQALEATLYGIAADGQESDTPLTELEVQYASLNVTMHVGDAVEKISSRETRPLEATSHSAATPLIQVDARHLEHLILHIEQLAEQRPSLERAQAQVEIVQQELFAAQVRLQHLEVVFSTASLSRKKPENWASYEPSTASLVSRILNETALRTGHTQWGKSRPRFQLAKPETAQGTVRWDELEIEAYTDDQLLIRSLDEAISDVVTASSRLRLALAQLYQALQKQVAQTTMIRDDALQLPHAHKAVQGLLVGIGGNGQHVVVPFSQLRRIDYKMDEKHNPLYTLNALLGLPERPTSLENTRPVLILEGDGAAVQVDEIVGEVEVMLKPLATHLQRPGILGTAADGVGHVLLLVDLPALLMSTDMVKQTPGLEELLREGNPSQKRWTVLIADDSVYIRQSVLQVLTHAGYNVLEARDGVEALERLLSSSIDVMLLDIEMPNLNGYELLNIIRANPQFTQLKVIMLTSRSSEKHRYHAQELGSHAYLTKPCPQDTLLATIQSVLV
jgi:chemotaxis protein histidine kinase CheA/CheY-like chemotaxis protein